jgi:uncharacterized repeat protein (TIGR03803 family)
MALKVCVAFSISALTRYSKAWRPRKWAAGGATAAFLLYVTIGTALEAQTFRSLVSFDGANGNNPRAGLIQGFNGNLYGTTYSGGASNSGTIFEISPAGKLTTLYSFCSQTDCADGSLPQAGLVQASDGNFYGTAFDGGAGNAGTVFEMTPAGELTTLHAFCAKTDCEDGKYPHARLTQAENGNFYGTTLEGGAKGKGTVFEITAAGSLTTLYGFCSQSNCTDGISPDAGLVQIADGNFYGVTVEGGASGNGTVFEITPAGKLTTLYSFCSQASCSDGVYPEADLVHAQNGRFYGTTYGDGTRSWGTIFEITPNGTLTTLYRFCSAANCPDGANPFELVQSTNGEFYGMTYAGGTGGADRIGTVFRLAENLAPNVETLPTRGKVAETVIILGTNLAGATAVSFNGAAASYIIVSSTEIRATIPGDATTGPVTVIIPARTLKSNESFQVIR